MNDLLWSAVLSMTPVGELRAGIPFAIAKGVNPWLALIVCVIANVIIVPIIFIFLEFIHYRFLHIHMYRSAFDRFMEKTRVKVHPFVEKYGMFGLALFVAVPFPLTGVYTASLAAWFFGMDKWKAFLSILAGAIIAGLIVLGVSVGGMKLFSVI